MDAARAWIVFVALGASASAQDQFAADRQLPKPKDPTFAIDVPAETPARPKPAPPIVGSAPSAGPGSLDLAEVLRSVDDHYPLLRAAEQERAIAGGRLVSAMGAFDTNLSLTNTNVPEGTFENYRYSFGLSQTFPFSGARVFTQYRGGYGDFPSYYGDRKTADGGEIRSGIQIPLLRDREIDRARATLEQARLNRDAAEPFVERQRIEFQRAAARVYWLWVAAAERLAILRSLVGLAEARDKQISRLVEEKLAAKLDRADNLQNLLGRSAGLVEAEQAFVQASIDLSLFLRDESGRPVLATLERRPGFPLLLEPDASQFEKALTYAAERRPELRRLRLQLQSAEVELRLARNQSQPSLNAIVAGVTDLGAGKPKTGKDRLDRNGLEVGFEMQAPAQFRDAKGREMAAAALLGQLTQQFRYQEDVIRVEVQSAFLALDRAYEQTRLARERVKYARQVAEGERQLFRDGLSELIRVNLREQSAFDADVLEVTAKLNYFRAMAEYRAALGMTGQ